MAVKCKITGSAKRKPAEDGSCPECTLPGVKLTPKGNIATHNMPLNLGDGPQIPVTDEGTRVGDPRDAAIRREVDAIEIRTGVTPVPVADSADVASVLRGPTLFRGRSMPTRVKEPDGPWAEMPASTQVPWTVDPNRAKGGTQTSLEGNLGRERPDTEAFAHNPKPKRTDAQKRKFRARQTAERQLRARLARQSSGKRA